MIRNLGYAAFAAAIAVSMFVFCGNPFGSRALDLELQIGARDGRRAVADFDILVNGIVVESTRADGSDFRVHNRGAVQADGLIDVAVQVGGRTSPSQQVLIDPGMLIEEDGHYVYRHVFDIVLGNVRVLVVDGDGAPLANVVIASGADSLSSTGVDGSAHLDVTEPTVIYPVLVDGVEFDPPETAVGSSAGVATFSVSRVTTAVSSTERGTLMIDGTRVQSLGGGDEFVSLPAGPGLAVFRPDRSDCRPDSHLVTVLARRATPISFASRCGEALAAVTPTQRDPVNRTPDALTRPPTRPSTEFTPADDVAQRAAAAQRADDTRRAPFVASTPSTPSSAGSAREPVREVDPEPARREPVREPVTRADPPPTRTSTSPSVTTTTPNTTTTTVPERPSRSEPMITPSVPTPAVPAPSRRDPVVAPPTAPRTSTPGSTTPAVPPIRLHFHTSKPGELVVNGVTLARLTPGTPFAKSYPLGTKIEARLLNVEGDCSHPRMSAVAEQGGGDIRFTTFDCSPCEKSRSFVDDYAAALTFAEDHPECAHLSTVVPPTSAYGQEEYREFLAYQGRSFAANGQWERAATAFRESLAFGTDARVGADLAICQTNRRRYSEAADALEVAERSAQLNGAPNEVWELIRAYQVFVLHGQFKASPPATSEGRDLYKSQICRAIATYEGRHSGGVNEALVGNVKALVCG